MKNLLKWPGFLFLILLLTAGLAGMAGAAPATGAKAPGAAVPAQYEEDEDETPPAPRSRGALEIRIQSGYGKLNPPGELVLSNPFGETLGFDPRYNSTYQEIAGGSYRRVVVPQSPSIEEAVLSINNAVSGTYSLRVVGVDYGQYRLSMKGYDRDRNHADLLFTIMIQPGEVHHYLINYANVGGASLNARRTRTRE